jgi:hypothetical protein
MGSMDLNLTLKDEEVYYRDIRLDDPTYLLPETPFEVRGRMVLGFRQLDSVRWGASPLYVLELSERVRERLEDADRPQHGERREPVVLEVVLRNDSKHAERFEVARARAVQGNMTVRNSDVTLKLNTLRTVGIGEVDYWLDTGSVVR